MHPFDWLIVFLLNGSVIAYGFYLAGGTKSSSEWFLGRRALPWWAIGLSMFATNVDSADIVSVTGKTFNEGLHIITVYAVGSALGGILAAFAIVPSMYRAGFYTNAEYLEARFGVSARVLSALIQIQYRSSMLGLMIWSIHVLLTGLKILGPVAAWILIVLLVICSGLYTAWGGLKSVVWTDALQGIVMMVGAAIIFFAVWNAVGGWSGMTASLEQQKLENLTHIGGYEGGDGTSSPYPFGWGAYIVVLGWTIIGTGYWTVNHTQTMRLMGARSLWDMKMAAVTGVALSLPIMIVCACLGIFGRALPELHGIEADQIYPALVNKYLGVGMKGLVVAGVVAAAVSTFDSMGSALSAIFTRDIYARLILQNGDDRHYVLVGRWATVGVLLLGFAYIPFILLQKNMLDAFTTLIPVFVTPLFTMYLAGVLTRANRRSGMIGLIVGSTFGLLALYCREATKIPWLPNATTIPTWLTDQWIALCWSFLITALTMAVATLFFGPDLRDQKLAINQSGWLKSSSETLPRLLEHPFQQSPSAWLNPTWYATALMAVSLYIVFWQYW